ncbi:hypothetical protein [Stackebrandtia nassauensis]|uniref:Lipoprotein n=1 Tax=Stackebrandtia nassauensis (strain DSM 44728 / CIP 108903 / NRRL B-16338 / NBRC 102104 / LLR-40K-21) TaxID=446470 RepID=D3PZ10_STANL|nr:hypothetical protein [Stackebrandtia nassauensis]ADD45439.1 hypothetical protein Snas_5809 [Stackebrandtia nassauensis DSM 44728]
MRIRAIAAMGLAAAALLTVSACRVEQGAALFVGDERISEKRVDEVVDSISASDRAKLADLNQLTGGQLPDISTGNLRGYVVDALVVTELGQRVAADTGVKPDRESSSVIKKNWELLELDSDSEFVQLTAEAEAYRTVLVDGSKPHRPSDKEVDALTAQLEHTFGQELDEQQKAGFAQFLTSEDGQVVVGQQRQVSDYIAEYDVTANPRYGQSFIVIARNAGPQPLITSDIPS